MVDEVVYEVEIQTMEQGKEPPMPTPQGHSNHRVVSSSRTTSHPSTPIDASRFQQALNSMEPTAPPNGSYGHLTLLV